MLVWFFSPLWHFSAARLRNKTPLPPPSCPLFISPSIFPEPTMAPHLSPLLLACSLIHLPLQILTWEKQFGRLGVHFPVLSCNSAVAGDRIYSRLLHKISSIWACDFLEWEDILCYIDNVLWNNRWKKKLLCFYDANAALYVGWITWWIIHNKHINTIISMDTCGGVHRLHNTQGREKGKDNSASGSQMV